MMSSDLLSPEESTKILQNRFNRKDIKYINLELKPISENIEGFFGIHYNLFITYELDNKTETEIFFIKTKPTSEAQIEMCDQFNVYKREIFCYDTLIKEFDKYKYDTSFAAESYYCVPDKSLILENLVHKGFELAERQTVYDLHHIKYTLKALALFHAAGFAYQETKTKELGSFILGKEYHEFMQELFFVFFINPNHTSMNWWNSSFKNLNRIIDLLPDDETQRFQFKSMLSSFPFGKMFVEETTFAKTCGHGDLWSNNMLFKYERGTPVDCRLVDFQICRYFYPCFDVLLAIFANTSAEFRKEHLDEMYQYYYNTLDNILTNYGYSIQNILPLNDFQESIRLTKADAILQVVSSMLVQYLPKEVLTNKTKENEGEALKELMFDSSDVYSDAFINDARYRKMVSDILQDLRNAMIDLQ